MDQTTTIKVHLKTDKELTVSHCKIQPMVPCLMVIDGVGNLIAVPWDNIDYVEGSPDMVQPVHGTIVTE